MFPTQTPAGPQNIQLHVADAKAPFASEFVGQFDIVHIRLLAAAIEPDEWEIVARNVMHLLKPDGMVQWVEPNFLTLFTPLRGTSTATTERAEYWYGTLKKLLPESRFSHGWSTLPDILRNKLGFKDVRHDLVSSDRLPGGREITTEM